MAKPKKRRKKPGSGGGRPTSGPTVIRDRLPELVTALDGADHEGPAWGAIHKLLLTSALDKESLGLVIARRDRVALGRIADIVAERDGDLSEYDPYADVVEAPVEIIEVDDETKRKAMRAFRKAHQIGEKGTFDKEVAAAMNIPCERKLQVILLNLRRWRHTARTAEDSFVEVNIAAMEVSLVLDGEPVARERTAVGAGKPRWDTETKRYIYPQATPIMQGSIERIVVNPWWNVPGSIYEGEYKRKIDSDPTWLDRHNYVLKPTAYGARLIQLPGPTNALGQLKIVFQNDASIYLHDTSQKGWFKFPRRDVSHGCIRVQNVFDFATKILQHDREKRGARFGSRTLHHMAKSNPSNTQALPVYEPMRVFLEYYTASISETGDVAFHPDIYDYDRDVLDGPRRKGGRRRR